MPGYMLIERGSLAPEKPDGVAAYPNELGLCDLLRELEAEEPALPRMYQFRLTGLEEVLYAAKPNDNALALEIRRRLARAASALESRLIAVQVVFQGKLQRGERFWVYYRGHELPVGLVFGSPMPETDRNGNRFFRVNFNLTSA